MADPQPDQKVMQAYKERRTRQIVATVPFLAVVLLILFAKESFNAPSVVSIFVFVYVIGLVIFSLRNWRCPGCNKYLGKGWNPKFCQNCGIQLRSTR